MKLDSGYFVISLDFELFWGVRDVYNLDVYGSNVLGARKAIPALLDLFDRYDVKATFATVGLLFCKDKYELMKSLPALFPQYKNTKLSPYRGYFDSIGTSEKEDPYHYATSLIDEIASRKKHEIATHTMSHYYCLEEGQTPEQFREDLRAAKKIASNAGLELQSIVFPRNQYISDYLDVCGSEGFHAFRGTEQSWIYESRSRKSETLLRRAFRLLDSYINVTGFNVHKPFMVNGLCNIPSSRFLRPYSKRFSFLEGLRLHRIKKQMIAAARRKKVFHIWWHPHNFGINLEENLLFLEKILQHHMSLRESAGFSSKTMAEISTDFFKQNDIKK